MGKVFGSRIHPKASQGILEVMQHSETSIAIICSPALVMRSSCCLCGDSRRGEFPLCKPAGQVSALFSLQAQAQGLTNGSL
jgi:hypothetical protein